MSRSELFNRAMWWLAQGIDLVPMRSNSKAVITGYGAHSKHIITEKLAWLWFEKVQVNLGVVCGGLLGLVCVDFDDAKACNQWRDGPGRGLETLIEQTARGYHVFAKCPELRSFATPEAEFKASGIVMVAPSIHPSGHRYEIVADDEITSLSVEQVKDFFPFVSAYLDAAQHEPPVSQPKSGRMRYTSTVEGDVVLRIKAVRSVLEEAVELTELKGRGGHYYGKCPFHDDHEPSFWVDDEAGLWGCYSPRCPSNAGGHKAHDVINLRMLAKHISARQAIKEMAKEHLRR